MRSVYLDLLSNVWHSAPVRCGQLPPPSPEGRWKAILKPSPFAREGRMWGSRSHARAQMSMRCTIYCSGMFSYGWEVDRILPALESRG